MRAAFSGGSSGLAIGHVSPETAAGGPLTLVEDGDLVTIDLPARTLHLHAPGLAARTSHFRPRHRERPLSTALRAYAALAQSADKGAVRGVLTADAQS
ncbi:hypothetical protein GCM10023195_05500 [Actinoallomurus liliacearum]|uniref:Dihydroxy-acid/6-phosphogluconate dehydratase C-terminal domain-containing protein n=1 Tax=Actinoallomurus liliacearum TaxID=1080073 RepID=A0ABP8TDB7_9ACTN